MPSVISEASPLDLHWHTSPCSVPIPRHGHTRQSTSHLCLTTLDQDPWEADVCWLLCSIGSACRESAEASPFIRVLAVYCCMRSNVTPDIEPRLWYDRRIALRLPAGARMFSSRRLPDRLQWPNSLLWGKLSPGVKRPGCESNHSSPTVAKVKHAWSCTSVNGEVLNWARGCHPLPLYPRVSNVAVPIGSDDCAFFIISEIHATCPTHLTLHDFITLIISGGY